MSRFTFAIQGLRSLTEDYDVAASRIRDADVATMVRLTILQRATTAVLAQANQQTTLAIALLKS